MGKLRKRIIKSARKYFQDEGLPMIQSALLTGFRTVGNELTKSPDLRTAAPDVLFRGLANAFRNGFAEAGRELVANGLDYIRSDRVDDVSPPPDQDAADEFGSTAGPGDDSGSEIR